MTWTAESEAIQQFTSECKIAHNARLSNKYMCIELNLGLSLLCIQMSIWSVAYTDFMIVFWTLVAVCIIQCFYCCHCAHAVLLMVNKKSAVKAKVLFMIQFNVS